MLGLEKIRRIGAQNMQEGVGMVESSSSAGRPAINAHALTILTGSEKKNGSLVLTFQEYRRREHCDAMWLTEHRNIAKSHVLNVVVIERIFCTSKRQERIAHG